MTVKELREILANLPDDCQVCYEYDGPDARTEVEADDYIVYSDRILLIEKAVGR